MDRQLKRDVRLVNIAGGLGTVYFRLAFAEIFLLFVTSCLGISKETWALVAAVVPITGVFHVASAYLTERLGHRKVLSLGCFAVSRLAVPAMTLLPFVTGQHETNVRLYCLAAALLTHSSLAALGSGAWVSWIADIVPTEHRGRFYSKRLMLSTLFDIVVFVSAGRLLDFIASRRTVLHGWASLGDPWRWHDLIAARTPPAGHGPNYADPWGYVVIFGLAFIAGEMDLLIHSRVPDRPMLPTGEKAGTWKMLIAPWRHAGFRNLMVFRMVLAVSDSIAGPFGLMYFYQELHLSVTWVTLQTSVFLVLSALTYGFWCKIGERLGYRTVCSISYLMTGFGMAYWWFLPQKHPAVYLPVILVAHMWFGAAWSGINLSLSTLTMNVAPRRHLSMYFAQVTMVLSLVVGLSIFCGRWVFIHTNPATAVYFLGTKMTGLHVLLGVIALIRIVGIWTLIRIVPDARAEAVMPRVDRILRANPLRIFPTLLSLERPLSASEREEHVDSLRVLLRGGPPRDGLDEALAAVLDNPVGPEHELYAIIGSERARDGTGFGRMLREIAELGPPHLSELRARAAARRIQRLHDGADLPGCLRFVRRLARQTAADIDSPRAAFALSVIEAIAAGQAGRAQPQEEAVLLALYAYLQILREPAKTAE